MKYLLIIILGFVFTLSACDNEPSDLQVKRRIDKKQVKETLIKTNQYLLKSEKQNIKDFIHRYHYQMNETGSGLFYEIYKKGNGSKAQKGKIAELNFSIRLLNGQMVYKSDEEGIKEFEIGKGGVESGLEEGILLLHIGDRARFIIPSHLAFGLLGDLDKIPEKAAIVYEIELLNLK